jgi:hypothetical protein
VMNALDIAGARATVTFVYLLQHTLATAGGMVARLLWREGAWQVTELTETTIGVEARRVPRRRSMTTPPLSVRLP